MVNACCTGAITASALTRPIFFLGIRKTTLKTCLKREETNTKPDAESDITRRSFRARRLNRLDRFMPPGVFLGLILRVGLVSVTPPSGRLSAGRIGSPFDFVKIPQQRPSAVAPSENEGRHCGAGVGRSEKRGLDFRASMDMIQASEKIPPWRDGWISVDVLPCGCANPLRSRAK